MVFAWKRKGQEQRVLVRPWQYCEAGVTVKTLRAQVSEGEVKVAIKMKMLQQPSQGTNMGMIEHEVLVCQTE